MSRRSYSEINLHITWHVKDGSPVLRDEIEVQTHRALRGEALKEPGVILHQIGGTDDHVHLVVTVPPTLLISEWIGRLKGASSHFINHHVVGRRVLEWQPKYGVVSFGSRALPWVVEYVRDQRQHHQAGRAKARLERTETDEDGKPAEAG
jgi:putative transposase